MVQTFDRAAGGTRGQAHWRGQRSGRFSPAPKKARSPSIPPNVPPDQQKLLAEKATQRALNVRPLSWIDTPLDSSAPLPLYSAAPMEHPKGSLSGDTLSSNTSGIGWTDTSMSSLGQPSNVDAADQASDSIKDTLLKFADRVAQRYPTAKDYRVVLPSAERRVKSATGRKPSREPLATPQRDASRDEEELSEFLSPAETESTKSAQQVVPYEAATTRGRSTVPTGPIPTGEGNTGKQASLRRNSRSQSNMVAELEFSRVTYPDSVWTKTPRGLSPAEKDIWCRHYMHLYQTAQDNVEVDGAHDVPQDWVIAPYVNNRSQYNLTRWDGVPPVDVLLPRGQPDWAKRLADEPHGSFSILRHVGPLSPIRSEALDVAGRKVAERKARQLAAYDVEENALTNWTRFGAHEYSRARSLDVEWAKKLAGFQRYRVRIAKKWAGVVKMLLQGATTEQHAQVMVERVSLLRKRKQTATSCVHWQLMVANLVERIQDELRHGAATGTSVALLQNIRRWGRLARLRLRGRLCPGMAWKMKHPDPFNERSGPIAVYTRIAMGMAYINEATLAERIADVTQRRRWAALVEKVQDRIAWSWKKNLLVLKHRRAMSQRWRDLMRKWRVGIEEARLDWVQELRQTAKSRQKPRAESVSPPKEAMSSRIERITKLDTDGSSSDDGRQRAPKAASEKKPLPVLKPDLLNLEEAPRSSRDTSSSERLEKKQQAENKKRVAAQLFPTTSRKLTQAYIRECADIGTCKDHHHYVDDAVPVEMTPIQRSAALPSDAKRKAEEEELKRAAARSSSAEKLRAENEELKKRLAEVDAQLARQIAREEAFGADVRAGVWKEKESSPLTEENLAAHASPEDSGYENEEWEEDEGYDSVDFAAGQAQEQEQTRW